MIKVIDYYIANKMFISKIGIVSPPAGALRCFCCFSTTGFRPWLNMCRPLRGLLIPAPQIFLE
jgi:hypothetical protein